MDQPERTRAKLSFFILLILIIFLSINAVILAQGARTKLGIDLNEGTVDDEIDLETLTIITSDTHVSFILQCYDDIDADDDDEPEGDFIVLIDVYEGTGDDKENHPFQGADFAVEAKEGKVYRWDGEKWKEDKSASVQVDVDDTTLSLTCLIDDVDYNGGSGNPEIGYLSNDKKISRNKINKDYTDIAPDDGWPRTDGVEDDIPGLGFLGSLAGSIFGLRLRSRANNDAKPGPRKWFSGLGPWIGVLRFIAFPLLLTLLLLFVVGFEPYQALIARICSSILSRLDVIHVIEGHSILLGLKNIPYKIVISEECSGISSLLMFASIVIGLPGVMNRNKIGAFLLGVPLLLLGDVIRISMIVFLSYIWDWAPYILLHDFFGRPLSLFWSLLVSSGYLFYAFYSFREKPS